MAHVHLHEFDSCATRAAGALRACISRGLRKHTCFSRYRFARIPFVGRELTFVCLAGRHIHAVCGRTAADCAIIRPLCAFEGCLCADADRQAFQSTLITFLYFHKER